MTDLRELAPRLGLVSHRGRWRDCPICKASRTKDGRHPLRLTEAHFWCNACGADGSAFALATWALLGREPREGDPELRRVYDFLGRDEQRLEPVAPAPPPPKRHAPVADLRAFLQRCPLAHQDVEVADYLRGRGIDPVKAPAGAVPRDMEAPFWPRGWSSVYRVVVPAFDIEGQLQNIHARAVVATERGKTRWADGLAASGLFFMNRAARSFIRGELRPEMLLITEGCIDYLDAAAQAAEDYPVLSIESGSAPALSAIRPLLPGVQVFIASHYDPTGVQRYEQQIAEAIAPHPFRFLRFDRAGAA